MQERIQFFLDAGKCVIYKGYRPALFENFAIPIFQDPRTIEGLIDSASIGNDALVVCMELMNPRGPRLVLFEQLSRLIEDGLFGGIRNTCVVLEDNLCTLYPLSITQPIQPGETEPILNSYATMEAIDASNYVGYITTPQCMETHLVFDEPPIELNSIDNNIANRSIPLDIAQSAVCSRIAELLNTDGPTLILDVAPRDPNLALHEPRLRRLNAVLQRCDGGVYLLNRPEEVPPNAPSECANELLRQYWGPDANFRNITMYAQPEQSDRKVELGQYVIVDAIIQECNNARAGKEFRDIFITAPTGSGKSMLFQLPAFNLSTDREVTIVVSPLKVLMQDQVNAITNARNFAKSTFINSDISYDDKSERIERIKGGDIDIVYLSPELLLSTNLNALIGDRKLRMVVVDEAHLVATWGKTFRPLYWYLGKHLKMLRRTTDHKFVVVACTATAVLGGPNDMVYDCMHALGMDNPQLFIGSVVRSDISFRIDQHPAPENGFNAFKATQAAEAATEFLHNDQKAIIYVPFKRLAGQVYNGLGPADQLLACTYHGGMSKEARARAYDQFSQGEKRLVVATKAFGMGVDISDINVVYHLAPTGKLSDYVQEIGRAARNPEIDGFARISYSPADLYYSNYLHFVSSINIWELRGVMKKLLYASNINGNRDVVLSVDGFANIFSDVQDEDDLGSKVYMALLMIETDYARRFGYPIISANVKPLFGTVFVRTSIEGFNRLREAHQDAVNVEIIQDNHAYLCIDLHRIWETMENRNITFNQLLFNPMQFGDGTRQVKFTFSLTENPDTVIGRIDELLVVLSKFLTECGNAWFSANDLSEYLNVQDNPDIRATSVMSTRILRMFASRTQGMELYDNNACLRESREPGPDGPDAIQYQVYPNRHVQCFRSIHNIMVTLFAERAQNYVRYRTPGEAPAWRLARLGYLLEVTGYGMFDVVGGKSQVVSVRVHNPNQLRGDIDNGGYRNSLVDDGQRQHDENNEIFDYFFTTPMNDDARWNMIERYFLGFSVDEIIAPE